jgi:2,4-dienoyl-CoA reductase-like NADH-dependent reductase (Old Yellow Enzyme family)
MALLFSPVEIGPLVAPNRIAISPMCQYSAIDGLPTEWHLQNAMTLAMSGAGVVMLEATAVEPRGRIPMRVPRPRSGRPTSWRMRFRTAAPI